VTDWREYQERVADLFRELGCSTEVEASVKGARAIHDIDVWVVFERFGLEHKWAIECKLWNTPIPKEKVQALKYIVEDVGADKGILVAESGFQPGANDTATSTNILLTTLGELQSLAKNDLQAMILEDLERRVIDLRERHYHLYAYKQRGPGVALASPRPGVDSENWVRTSALLGALGYGFERIKIDQFPVPVGIDFDVDGYEMATSKKEFIELAAHTINQVDTWISKQEASIEATPQEGVDPT
jgi:hypothetical protein